MGILHRVLGVMNSRRHFLRNIIVGSPLLVGARAFAQDAPAAVRVPVNDPVATALGYVEDATKVDKAKYPQYKAGQICENCALYTGPAGKEDGPCTIFQKPPGDRQGLVRDLRSQASCSSRCPSRVSCPPRTQAFSPLQAF